MKRKVIIITTPLQVIERKKIALNVNSSSRIQDLMIEHLVANIRLCFVFMSVPLGGGLSHSDTVFLLLIRSIFVRTCLNSSLDISSRVFGCVQRELRFCQGDLWKCLKAGKKEIYENDSRRCVYVVSWTGLKDHEYKFSKRKFILKLD